MKNDKEFKDTKQVRVDCWNRCRSPWDTIRRYGMRNFMLDKKSKALMSIGNDRASAACEAEKAAGNWHITSYWH
ncbi:unnamed protein product [Rhodiola kirilowii]